jgi:RPA family protein
MEHVMQCKVIENTWTRNPAIYLNGTLVRSDKYVYCNYAGTFTPESITFLDLTLLQGDDLIIVYADKRYEYPIYKAVHAGTIIDLRPEPVSAEEPST